MHYFPHISMKDILWGYSYANVVMLMSSVPTYNPKDQKKEETNNLEVKGIDEIRGLL